MRFKHPIIAGILIAAGCSREAPLPQPQQTQQTKTGQPAVPEKVAAKNLPNPWRIHAKVISGGLPEGDAAFKELADLGVRTVISVDGAKPNVALAKKHGMRYVHLPHGYDGVPDQRAQELAKAVRDLEGPIYIHCHHGKHRSPGAAAVACVGAGMIPATYAEAFLKAAGTSESYKGLYESARSTRQFDSKLLDALEAHFPETAELAPMADAMVAVEHTHDHLKQIAAAGWKSPPEHPDLEPPHEALLLREHFTEMLRLPAVAQEPEGFRRMLRESEVSSEELENVLRKWKADGQSGAAPPEATKAFDHVTAQCKACHTTYRDVPLSRKGKAAK